MAVAANWFELEQEIAKVLKPERRPAAVTFLDHEPAGVKTPRRQRSGVPSNARG